MKEGHRFPPLEEGEPTTNPFPRGNGWVCFHCGERFINPTLARDHFGDNPDSIPGCILKVRTGLADEQGMLAVIRNIERGLNVILDYLNEEHWDTTAKPEDAISNAWDKVHELLAIVQPWRGESDVSKEETKAKP